jgi:ABC-type transport system involved in multi-copper enzyme maturation permease subunit
MRKIIAIAAFTVISAVRSRLFAAAAVALVAAIVGLPFIIRGDGTPESRSGIFINYAFGLMMIILSFTATWCGAGVISLEISGRQIQNLVTKPLKSFQIWIGKLLGLMLVNLVLLLLGGVLIGGFLHWMIRPVKTDTTAQYDLRRRVLNVYRIIPPLKPTASQTGGAAIGPGQVYRWRFDLGGRTKDARFALIKFHFIPSPFAHQSPVAGAWRAFTANKELVNQPVVMSPNMTAYLTVAGLNASGLLNLEYANLQTNPAVTVFFPSEDDLCLLFPESGFASNLLRGLIVAFARLAFMTSLGMIAGALFSFPVAAFASLGLMALAFSGGMLRHLAANGLLTDPGEQVAPLIVILNDMVRGAFGFLSKTLPPLDRFDAAGYLANNLFIPWGLVGESMLVLCVLYPLVLMLFGVFCFNRREIGLSFQ